MKTQALLPIRPITADCSTSLEHIGQGVDVGRHDTLEKLAGAMASTDADTCGDALASSRASYEMVAKTAAANIPILAAVAAPNALVTEYAQAAGLTLLGRVQPQRQQIYTHPERLRANL